MSMDTHIRKSYVYAKLFQVESPLLVLLLENFCLPAIVPADSDSGKLEFCWVVEYGRWLLATFSNKLISYKSIFVGYK